MHLLLTSEDLTTESDHGPHESLDANIESDRYGRLGNGCNDERRSSDAACRASLLNDESGISKFSNEDSNRAPIEPGEGDEVRAARWTTNVQPAQDPCEIVAADLVLRCR